MSSPSSASNSTNMLMTFNFDRAVNVNKSSHASTDLPECTSDIYDWLLHNCLALNPDKSESAVFGTSSKMIAVSKSSLRLSLGH